MLDYVKESIIHSFKSQIIINQLQRNLSHIISQDIAFVCDELLLTNKWVYEYCFDKYHSIVFVGFIVDEKSHCPNVQIDASSNSGLSWK